MLLRSLVIALLLSGPLAAQDTRPEPRDGDAETDNVMPTTDGDVLALSMLMAIDDAGVALADRGRLGNPPLPVADFAKRLFDESTVQRARSGEVASAINASPETRGDPGTYASNAAQRTDKLASMDDGDEFNLTFLNASIAHLEDAIRLIDSRLLRSAHNDDVTEHLGLARSRYVNLLQAAREALDHPDR